MSTFPIPVMPPFMPLAEHDFPITRRENLMRAFRHEKPMWMPMIYQDTQWVFPACFNDLPLDPTKDGEDWFGTKYKYEAAQAGHTPIPGLFDSIDEWREKMIFPDLDNMDWGFIPGFERDERFAAAGRLGNGNFERLHMSEGFEQALCDILVEQEECKAFFDRLTEYKIDIMDHIIAKTPCDFQCHNDDWATARSSFFSNEVFENTLLDSAVALADAIHARGQGYMLHCCGKMEAFLPYIVNDIKADILEIQTINDLRMVLDTYGAKTSPIYTPDPYIMYNPATTGEQAREYARYIVDNFGAHTCEGAGCLIYLVGNKSESYYAFEDEIFKYSLRKYKDLQ